MSDSRSTLNKLGTVVFCVVLIVLGGWLLVDPHSISFAEMRLGGRHALIKSTFQFLGENIGAAPLGALLVAVGGLWLVTSARPRKSETA